MQAITRSTSTNIHEPKMKRSLSTGDLRSGTQLSLDQISALHAEIKSKLTIHRAQSDAKLERTNSAQLLQGGEIAKLHQYIHKLEQQHGELIAAFHELATGQQRSVELQSVISNSVEANAMGQDAIHRELRELRQHVRALVGIVSRNTIPSTPPSAASNIPRNSSERHFQ